MEMCTALCAAVTDLEGFHVIGQLELLNEARLGPTGPSIVITGTVQRGPPASCMHGLH